MKHLSVGEGSGLAFELARLRLAKADEERSAWLSARCREMTPEERSEPLLCKECNSPLPQTCASDRCKRCRNREAMREARARRASGVGHPVGYIACAGCGTSIRKWSESRTRRVVCDDCIPLARGGHLNRTEAA